MKNTLLFFAAFTCMQAVLSQEKSQAELKTSLLKKAKSQKALAITSVTVGSVFVVIGVTGLVLDSVEINDGSGQFFYGSESDALLAAGVAFTLTGAAMQGISIPLFIKSAKNKKAAMSISFTNEKYIPALAGKNAFSYYPAVRLKIGF